MPVDPKTIISRLASTNGDGTGTTNAIGDYTTPIELKVTPATRQGLEIHRMIVGVEDSASSMSPGEYGGLGAALSNGIVVSVKNSSGTLYTLTAFPITTNLEWAQHCHDLQQHTWGTGNDGYSVRWTFSKSGYPVVIADNDDTWLSIDLSDNFTGLITHRFIVQGYEI
jgi:hypothetical protein